MSGLKPNASDPHVFGVVRIDSYHDLDVDLVEGRLSLTGVFTTAESAERDAARLNALAEQRGSGRTARYVTLVSRLKQQGPGEPT